MDLFFDNEFRSLIPVLQPDELKGLEESLIREGNRDPIVIWKETSLLLDGHNRYDICAQKGIKLQPPVELSLSDREAAKAWIINNQFSRRNISPYVRTVLALKLEVIYKEQAELRMKAGKAIDPTPTLAEGVKGETRDIIATKARVSHGTVAKVKVIESKATPEQKQLLSEGKKTINQVYVQLKREEILKEQRENIAYAEAHPEEVPVGNVTYGITPGGFKFKETITGEMNGFPFIKNDSADPEYDALEANESSMELKMSLDHIFSILKDLKKNIKKCLENGEDIEKAYWVDLNHGIARTPMGLTPALMDVAEAATRFNRRFVKGLEYKLFEGSFDEAGKKITDESRVGLEVRPTGRPGWTTWGLEA